MSDRQHASAVLAGSSLFDAQYYASISGCDEDRLKAARHYLRRGAKRGLQPHPMFDPQHALTTCPALAQGADPLLAYIEQRPFSAATHPLFDVEDYVRCHPEAIDHPDGPIAHYVEIGAAAAFSPNHWYEPNEDEPRGLVDWLVARHEEWSNRRSETVAAGAAPSSPSQEADFKKLYTSPASDTGTAVAGRSSKPGDSTTVVTVLIDAPNASRELTNSLRSLLDQDLAGVEVLLVTADAASNLEAFAARSFPDGQIRVVQTGAASPATRLNVALAEAAGEYVAWMSPGDQWPSGRLSLLTSVCRREGTAIAYDSLLLRKEGKQVVRGHAVPSSSRPSSLMGVDLCRMLVARDAVDEVGAFDPTMLSAWTVELSFRLILAHTASHVPVVGVVRDDAPGNAASPTPDPGRFPHHVFVETWADVAFNRHAIDWAALESRQSCPNVVTVIVPTFQDWKLTHACLQSLSAAAVPSDKTVEIVVWDNGSNAVTSQVLDAMAREFDRVTVHHSPSNLGFALANNLALGAARGDTVIFLNNDTEVEHEWLAPLLTSLEKPEVLGVQSLLLYPSGTVQSAGVVFPSCGGIPYNFLQDFPVEDARNMHEFRMSALTGAALAVRFQDLIALRGFDPLFRNGMEDVDLCLRLTRLRPGGSFRVEPRSRVTHHESQTPGRFDKSVLNRHLLLERWGVESPRDDKQMWSACGFEILDRVIRRPVSQDRRVCVPEPVLRRRPDSVQQYPPRLRWALKVGAPTGAAGEDAEDSRFAQHLAVALRHLGQEVVVDYPSEFFRRSGHLDDVAVAVRGNEPFYPEFGQVSIAWVISHPEHFSNREAASYDRVFAASESWSLEMSRRWGLQIEPLLTATDPQLFHPGRGVGDAGHRVLFVGGSLGRYRNVVRRAVLMGLPIAVYGSGWEDLIPADLIQADHVADREVGALYASAGVVLIDHSDHMRRHGFISSALFDAVASGARVISDDVRGLHGFFDTSVRVARDAHDLSRLIGSAHRDEVFGAGEQRQETSLRVQREHSFSVRARCLLHSALEVHFANEGQSGCQR